MSSFRTSRPSLTSKRRGCKTIGGRRFWNHTFEWAPEGIFLRNISWSSLRVGCRSWTATLQSSSGLFSMRRGGSLTQKRFILLPLLFLGTKIFLSLFAEFWSLCAFSLGHPFLNVFLRLNFKLCLVQQGRAQSYLFSGSLPNQKVTREVMRRDPSRLVIAASGWTDFEVNLRIITESETNLTLRSVWEPSQNQW